MAHPFQPNNNLIPAKDTSVIQPKSPHTDHDSNKKPLKEALVKLVLPDGYVLTYNITCREK